jgi:hypothetical protein
MDSAVISLVATAPALHPHTSRAAFIRHAVEMLIAMILGMMLFGGLISLVLAVLGHSNLTHYAALRALVMATNMTIGMSLWMRYRGHNWARISEMGASMYVPFLVLLIPFWTGLITGGGLLGGGHLLMLPAMLGVMLYRRTEYSRPHGDHGMAASQS